MANRPLPDQATLLKLLRYDPETGRLFWRERTADTCADERVRKSFNGRLANRPALDCVSKGYRIGALSGQMLKAHRVVWCMAYGDWPAMIDHINQDRSDNRLANLRLTDTVGNGRNAKLSKRNKSGRCGITLDKRYGTWRAQIGEGGNRVHLGAFKTFEEAVAARSTAERQLGFDQNHGRQV